MLFNPSSLQIQSFTYNNRELKRRSRHDPSRSMAHRPNRLSIANANSPHTEPSAATITPYAPRCLTPLYQPNISAKNPQMLWQDTERARQDTAELAVQVQLNRSRGDDLHIVGAEMHDTLVVDMLAAKS